METVFDTCRLCGVKSTDPMINIKNSDSDLEHKLFKCCQIQLNDEDTLSQKSCSDCIERLENCFFFIINVENTQEYLKNTQDQLFIVEFSDTTVEIKVLEQIINSDEAAPQNTEMKRELRDRKSIKKPNEVESLSMSKTEQKVTKPKRGRKKGSKRFEKLRYTMEDIFESELKSLKFKPTTTLAVPDNEKNRDGTLNEEGKNRFSTSNWSAMIWKCVDCKNEKFNNINELQNHFITAHKKKESYLCPFCPKTVSKFASCFNHVTDYHKNFLTYCCQVCDEYRWNFMDLYKHHRKAHPDNKIFLCIYCGKNFHCGSILRDHKISCHGNESGDMKQTPTGYKCNQCEKSFTLKRNLHNHMQTHLEKQHVCDKCGKTFMQKGNLLNHQITHSDLRPFTCLVCDTSFKTMKRLRFHNLTHTKVKSHVCDVCNRSFALRTTLKVHYRIHTQVTPYECPTCGKKFRFNHCLTTHIRTHTGERPYSCTVCMHHFTNWPNYNKHMKLRHGIDTSKRAKRREQEHQYLQNNAKGDFSHIISTPGKIPDKCSVEKMEESYSFSMDMPEKLV